MDNKKQLECYHCKGTYFRVICKQHEYDNVDVFALKCVECGHEIEFQKPTWVYGGISARLLPTLKSRVSDEVS